ncbi:hypothetical protein SAMN05444280_1015 [Tangfeifania diversioriginum]|uniref:LexA-binding, inner membrane-associated hydrolase n=1 Tax=Tangfeifania diversioriginum TaxID=1168035 RepID=A0A1M6A0L9_9BACT|nr:DUF6122 family protein [Tangfeifania diversioriginum]SHI30047.1 hypothetical protein SAMN05444280_1015 [Tangfeifania diversioriginum]
MQQFVHYFLHLVFPLLIAFVFFRKEWKKVYLILLATMLVDLDHLLATPIFEANRCSINFHILHTYYAMGVYGLLLFFRKPFNIIGIGLLFHMLTDLIDCLWMYTNCKSCFAGSPAFELLSGISRLLGI